jgi:hypothetical protein
VQADLAVSRSPLDPSNAAGKPWTNFASNSAVFGVRPASSRLRDHAFSPKASSNTIIILTRDAVAGGQVHA